ELYGSAGAVAAQALRRIGAGPTSGGTPGTRLTVLLGGHEAPLPTAALTYLEGRLLQAVSPAL
ncbi:glutamate racemase, partial [Streptomyces sp. SID10853]|nr:glutamate racemase [Streptomyces sp. SID10853]